jgi:hypothetical protein
MAMCTSYDDADEDTDGDGSSNLKVFQNFLYLIPDKAAQNL